VERDDVGADVAGVNAAIREEGAVGIQRQLGVRCQVAPLVVGQERLPPVGRPLDEIAEAE